MFPRSLIATYLTLPAAPAMVFAQGGTEAKTGYAALHGLKMYYRIQDAGRPLVLLPRRTLKHRYRLREAIARACEAAAGNRGRATGTRSYRRR
jgi:hypothetical protein